MTVVLKVAQKEVMQVALKVFQMVGENERQWDVKMVVQKVLPKA